MRRHYTAISMHQRMACIFYLSMARSLTQLPHGLYRMAHSTSHAAVPKRKQAPMGIKGQRPIAMKVTVSNALRRTTSGGEANFFQKHDECDSEGVVDADVVNITERQTSLFQGTLRGLARPTGQY